MLQIWISMYWSDLLLSNSSKSLSWMAGEWYHSCRRPSSALLYLVVRFRVWPKFLARWSTMRNCYPYKLRPLPLLVHLTGTRWKAVWIRAPSLMRMELYYLEVKILLKCWNLMRCFIYCKRLLPRTKWVFMQNLGGTLDWVGLDWQTQIEILSEPLDEGEAWNLKMFWEPCLHQETPARIRRNIFCRTFRWRIWIWCFVQWAPVTLVGLSSMLRKILALIFYVRSSTAYIRTGQTSYIEHCVD